MASLDEWHAFGHAYAPKDAWNPLMVSPGMRTLVIEGKREGSRADRLQVKLEPSTKVPTGVYIAVNEHYEVQSAEDVPGPERMVLMLETLQNAWDGFVAYQSTIANHLLTAYKSSRG